MGWGGRMRRSKNSNSDEKWMKMQLTTPLPHPYSTLVGKWLDAIPPIMVIIQISLLYYTSYHPDSALMRSAPHSIHPTCPLQKRQSSARSRSLKVPQSPEKSRMKLSQTFITACRGGEHIQGQGNADLWVVGTHSLTQQRNAP